MSSEAGPSSAPPPPKPSSISPTLPSTSSLSSPSVTQSSPSMDSTNRSIPRGPLSPEQTRQVNEARTALLASMSNIGAGLDKELQARARSLHDNSKDGKLTEEQVLEKQEKELKKNTEMLRKEGDRLGKELAEGGRRVKELGNVQNWAEVLERDFLVLQETMRLADGSSESSWTTSEEGSDNGDGEGVGADRGQSGATRQEDHMDAEVDPEGDTRMGEVGEVVDKGKGKGAMGVIGGGTDVQGAPAEGEAGQLAEVVGGSSTATTVDNSDPSGSSLHTGASGSASVGS